MNQADIYRLFQAQTLIDATEKGEDVQLDQDGKIKINSNSVEKVMAAFVEGKIQ